jgi:hypothetical protein
MAGERIYTKEECESELAKAQANMIIWTTFLQVMERGDFVMIDESKKEPIYKVVKAQRLGH